MSFVDITIKPNVEEMKAIDPTTFKQFLGSTVGLSQDYEFLADFAWNEHYNMEIVFLYARTTDMPPAELNVLISKMQ
jgi:hypothetical protein